MAGGATLIDYFQVQAEAGYHIVFSAVLFGCFFQVCRKGERKWAKVYLSWRK